MKSAIIAVLALLLQAVPIPTLAPSWDVEAWIVSFDGPLDPGENAALRALATDVHPYQSFPGAYVQGEAGLGTALQALSFVTRLDQDEEVSPHLDRGRWLVRAPAAQHVEPPAQDAWAVAIIDSGVDATHPALAGRIRHAVTLGTDGVAAGSYDERGHGTFVASIAAGTGDASPDLAYRGVAPDVALVAVDLGTRWSVDGVIRALDWVLANHEEYGVRVALASLGRLEGTDRFDPEDPLARAANGLHEAGVVLVTSAGNRAGQRMSNEALAPWVVTVAAVDAVGRAASFNTVAPPGVAKPDVWAPGRDVIAARASSQDAQVASPRNKAPQAYAEDDGTSYAAAHVAGAVAHAWSKAPQASPDDVIGWVRASAVASPVDSGVRVLDVPLLVSVATGEYKEVQATVTSWSQTVQVPAGQAAWSAEFPVSVWAQRLDVRVTWPGHALSSVHLFDEDGRAVEARHAGDAWSAEDSLPAGIWRAQVLAEGSPTVASPAWLNVTAHERRSVVADPEDSKDAARSIPGLQTLTLAAALVLVLALRRRCQ